MPFSPTDFHDLLDPDLWVIEQMLTLPSDPEPTITAKGGTVHVELTSTVGMSQFRDAVTNYRLHLLPVIVVISQKVYAELFRLVLDQCGKSAGNRQVDIEHALASLVAARRVTKHLPFPDAATFQDWWSGKYDFTKLRLARNELVHGSYSFKNGRLTVKDKSGSPVLDWTEAEILTFASEVLSLSKKV